MLVKKSFLKESIFILALIAITIAVALYSLDFPNLSFHQYSGLASGDSMYFNMVAKSIREFGLKGLYVNSRLGAPGVCALVDFPSVDLLMALWIVVINIFTADAACTVYVYLILTFVLAALMLYLLLKTIGIDSMIALVLSVVYAIAPYHFFRYIAHLNLSGYYTIPLAILISLYIAGLLRQQNRKKRNILLALSAVLLGIGCAYYLFFGLILIAFSIIINLVSITAHEKRISREVITDCIKRLWPLAVCTVSFLCTQIPQIVYAARYGANNAIVRPAMDAEVYGLKIIQLFLSPSYSLFCTPLTNQYNANSLFVNENVFSALGIVAAFGLVLLVAYLVCRIIRKNSSFDIPDYLALSCLGCVLVGTVGGIGAIFNWVITPQFRCYNRICVVISCFALTYLAILLMKLKNKHFILSCVALLAIAVIGFFDQVTIPIKYDSNEAKQQEIYADYLKQIEQSVEPGARIYQLPFIFFPGNAVNQVGEYKQFIGYLFTDTLKWSFGEIVSRSTLTRDLYTDDGMSVSFLEGLRNSGFAGLYIDTDGYADSGKEMIAFYDSLGMQPLVSADKTLYFYKLPEFSERILEHRKSYWFVYTIANELSIDVEDDALEKVAVSLEDDAVYAADVIYGWIISTNGSANMSNAAYIERVYSLLFPDMLATDDVKIWTAALEAGADRGEILEKLLASKELEGRLFSSTRKFARTFCREYAGENELSLEGQLAEALETNLSNAADIMYSIVESNATLQSLSDIEYVNWLYLEILGREADASGRDSWEAAMSTGMSRHDMLYGFLVSSEAKMHIELQ